MKRPSEIFIANVARRMATLGIVTQSELARMANVHRVVLNRLLTGKHDPDIATVAKIAQALNCEPWELLREDTTPIVEEPTIPEVLSLLQLYESAPKEARDYARYILERFGRPPAPGDKELQSTIERKPPAPQTGHDPETPALNLEPAEQPARKSKATSAIERPPDKSRRDARPR